MSQGDIMVEPKRPMTVKWNTYKNGELRTRITKEIKQIASKKDYRRKLGLELGALREFKGNTHWNLYIVLELAELITERMNEDLRNIFLQTTQGINSTNGYLNNITEQIKKAEYNISNATTLSGNNVIKFVRAEVAKIDKLSNNLTKIQKSIDEKLEAASKEIKEASETLSEKLIESLEKLQNELNERNEATQAIITEDVKSLKDFNSTKFIELSDQANSLGKQSSKAITDLSKEISNKFSGMSKDIKELHESITNFHEGTNNILDDQQNTIITEFQEGIGGLMKQNLDNVDNMKKEFVEQTTQVLGRMDETTENLTSIFEATNAHMDKINENINNNIKLTEEEFKKEIKTEITDLRTTISTIRSDIELMKSVLTKLDSKIL